MLKTAIAWRQTCRLADSLGLALAAREGGGVAVLDAGGGDELWRLPSAPVALAALAALARQAKCGPCLPRWAGVRGPCCERVTELWATREAAAEACFADSRVEGLHLFRQSPQTGDWHLLVRGMVPRPVPAWPLPPAQGPLRPPAPRLVPPDRRACVLLAPLRSLLDACPAEDGLASLSFDFDREASRWDVRASAEGAALGVLRSAPAARLSRARPWALTFSLARLRRALGALGENQWAEVEYPGADWPAVVRGCDTAVQVDLPPCAVGGAHAPGRRPAGLWPF